MSDFNFNLTFNTEIPKNGHLLVNFILLESSIIRRKFCFFLNVQLYCTPEGVLSEVSFPHAVALAESFSK
jgi:hypothetical protein